MTVQAVKEIGKLEAQGISKIFSLEGGKTVTVLQETDLQVSKGEFLSIVGPSGCGKTTFLRLIAGLDGDYDGRLLLDDIDIKGPSVKRGMVFQEPRLFPWLTVEQNIVFGLEKSKGNGSADVVREHIELVGLKGFENVYPHQISGGMAQRVAIARALVNRPEVLLLDEPFGALDAITRQYMQDELAKIWQAEGVTMVLVTHDIEEAAYLGDRVAVMSCRPGKIEQLLHVPFERPRHRDGLEFLKFCAATRASFHQLVGNPCDLCDLHEAI